MANTDTLRGLYPLYHLNGGEIRTNSYVVTTSAAIYKGDLVSMINTGCVSASSADDGIIVVGVAAEYIPAAVSATAGTLIQVYDDPKIVFGVQADSGTSVAAADVWATANHVATTGSATTGLSAHELDSSDIGTGLQFRIIGKVESPDNAWGEHVELRVIFNEHAYKGAGTATV
jgi:hypothetical protein